MFDLKTASLSLRKAAALNGVRSGQYEPIFEPTDVPERVVAKIHPAKGEPFSVTAGEVEYAGSRTWDDINRYA